MQYTQQQRLAPEAPDESTLYSPIGTRWLTYGAWCRVIRRLYLPSKQLNAIRKSPRERPHYSSRSGRRMWLDLNKLNIERSVARCRDWFPTDDRQRCYSPAEDVPVPMEAYIAVNIPLYRLPCGTVSSNDNDVIT